MFRSCQVCKGAGICSDKELKFFPVVCYNCQGKCIIDEHTGKPFGFESDLEAAEAAEREEKEEL